LLPWLELRTLRAWLFGAVAATDPLGAGLLARLLAFFPRLRALRMRFLTVAPLRATFAVLFLGQSRRCRRAREKNGNKEFTHDYTFSVP